MTLTGPQPPRDPQTLALKVQAGLVQQRHLLLTIDALLSKER